MSTIEELIARECAIARKALEAVPSYVERYTARSTEYCFECGRIFSRKQLLGVDLVLDEQGQEVILYACQECDPHTWKYTIRLGGV